jgi:hypothetical protein
MLLDDMIQTIMVVRGSLWFCVFTSLALNAVAIDVHFPMLSLCLSSWLVIFFIHAVLLSK